MDVLKRYSNVLAFAIAGGVTMAVTVLSLFDDDQAINILMIISAIFIFYLQWREIVIKQKLPFLRFASLFFVLIFLYAFLLPTPLQYLYTGGILWGGIAVLVFNILSGQPSLNSQLGKWFLVMLISWGIWALVGEGLANVFPPVYIPFPYGVYIGYNLFFLSSALCIFNVYLFYKPHLSFGNSMKLLLMVVVGALVGSLLSIPVIMLVLEVAHFQSESLPFITAMTLSVMCEYTGGGILACWGYARLSARTALSYEPDSN